MVADTASTFGIAEILDEHLVGLTPDTVTYTAGTVMSSLAVALTAGATCLDDLDLLRPWSTPVWPVPSTPSQPHTGGSTNSPTTPTPSTNR
ncbi:MULTISPECIES: hypothetical protein [Corynebacterium]|uniref:hypothetical protein n=1 Tax=Corynebacterium TaxID=1716 RepID=UPI0002F1E738|nr:hypothetical protein [Corynebacterium variabile]